MARTTLRQRILSELRASPLPIGTGDLAALCGAGFRRPVQQTNAELRTLERCRVVRRLPPVARGPGRPASRWVLTSWGG